MIYPENTPKKNPLEIPGRPDIGVKPIEIPMSPYVPQRPERQKDVPWRRRIGVPGRYMPQPLEVPESPTEEPMPA